MSYPVRDAFNFSRPGAWGTVTSTLDFCEANYQFSHYVAELANTVSNIVTIVLAIHGASTVWNEKLPLRYLFGFLSVGIVGLGSMAFHATLTHTAQLSDELPMIYAASISLFFVFDTRRGHNIRGNKFAQSMVFIIASFDILFTYTYWLYRNPVFHQVVFAALLLVITARGAWILRLSEASLRLDMKAKNQIATLYNWGAGMFIAGFIIWNIDNIFCDALSGLKLILHWPTAFLLEGHSWWHVFTATGSYYMMVGTTCKFVNPRYLVLLLKNVYLTQPFRTLSVKEGPGEYDVTYVKCIPHVHRISKSYRKRQ